MRKLSGDEAENPGMTTSNVTSGFDKDGLLTMCEMPSAMPQSIAIFGVSIVTLTAAWFALVGGSFWPIYAPLAFGWVFYLFCTGTAYLQERAQRLDAELTLQSLTTGGTEVRIHLVMEGQPSE